MRKYVTKVCVKGQFCGGVFAEIFVKCQYCGAEHEFIFCPKCGNRAGETKEKHLSLEEIEAFVQHLPELEDSAFDISVAHGLSCLNHSFEKIHCKTDDERHALNIFENQLKVYRKVYKKSFEELLKNYSYIEQSLVSTIKDSKKGKPLENKTIKEPIAENQAQTNLLKQRIKKEKKNKLSDDLFNSVDEDSLLSIAYSAMFNDEREIEGGDEVTKEDKAIEEDNTSIANEENSDNNIHDNIEKERENEDKDEDEISIDNISSNIFITNTSENDYTGVLSDEGTIVSEDGKCHDILNEKEEKKDFENASIINPESVTVDNFSVFEHQLNETKTTLAEEKTPKNKKEKKQKPEKKKKEKKNKEKHHKEGIKNKTEKPKKKGKGKIIVVDPEKDTEYDGYYDDVPVVGEIERSYSQKVISENSKTLIILGTAVLVGVIFVIYGIMSIF